MVKTLIVLVLLSGSSVLGQSKNVDSKPAPESVEITSEQRLQLELVSEQLKRAQSDAEAARLRAENAQLRYTLATTQIRSTLKIGDEYKWDDREWKFVLISAEAKGAKEKR